MRNAIKQFVHEEKTVSIIGMTSLALVFLYAATDRIPELFKGGYEIMEVTFALSASITAGVIFYIFQTYLPSIRVRKIAKKEFEVICNRFVSAFTDILISCSTSDEIQQNDINTLEDFLSDTVANHISINFDMETTANISPKMLRTNRLALLAEDIRHYCDTIASKYSSHLTEKMLVTLHDMNIQPLVEYMRILTNQESLEYQKKHQGRTYCKIVN